MVDIYLYASRLFVVEIWCDLSGCADLSYCDIIPLYHTTFFLIGGSLCFLISRPAAVSMFLPRLRTDNFTLSSLGLWALLDLEDAKVAISHANHRTKKDPKRTPSSGRRSNSSRSWIHESHYLESVIMMTWSMNP